MGRRADLHRCRRALRREDEDADRIVLRHAVERRVAAGASGGNEVADVYLPLDDDPGERGTDLLESLGCSQPVDLRLREIDLRNCRVLSRLRTLRSGLFLLALLLGHHALWRIIPALVRAAGKARFGLADRYLGIGGPEASLGGHELGVQSRGLDRREHLALVHMVADVDEPLPQ